MNRWDEFVRNSPNGTIFHERTFISYHPKGKFEDNSLIFYKENTDIIVAVFPAAKIIDNDKVILKSHPGTSYGGLVFYRSINLKHSFDILKSLEDYAKEHHFNSIEFRLAEKIFFSSQFDQIDFALLHNSYIRKHEELSTYYNLKEYHNLSENEIEACFDNKSRSKVKQWISKGRKNNLECRYAITNDDICRFYEILNQNLENKHKTKAVHSLEDIKTLMSLYPDRVKIFAVYQEGNMIGGFLIFNVNKQGWHIFYSAMDYEYSSMRPQNFCLFGLICHLSQKKESILNFGISTEKGGTFINWGLFEFKESFNGEGAIRTYWKKDL